MADSFFEIYNEAVMNLSDIISLLSGAYATLEFDSNKSAALHLISLAKDYSEGVKEMVEQESSNNPGEQRVWQLSGADYLVVFLTRTVSPPPDRCCSRAAQWYDQYLKER